jgi:hypothetical protein
MKISFTAGNVYKVLCLLGVESHNVSGIARLTYIDVYKVKAIVLMLLRLELVEKHRLLNGVNAYKIKSKSVELPKWMRKEDNITVL